MENHSTAYVTVHGRNERHGTNVSLNYATDNAAEAFELCEKLHPDVRITGHTLHIN